MTRLVDCTPTIRAIVGMRPAAAAHFARACGVSIVSTADAPTVAVLGAAPSGISRKTPGETGTPSLNVTSRPSTREPPNDCTSISFPCVNRRPRERHRRCRCSLGSLDLDLLDEGARVAKRVQTELPHRGTEVGRGDPLVPRSAATPVERVAREELHVAANRGFVDDRLA